MYVILKMAECLRESLECSVPRNTINNGLMQIYFDKVDKLCKLSSEVFLNTESTELWISHLYFSFSLILGFYFLKEDYIVSVQNRALEEH